MSENHQVIRVFIASPGGLEVERKAVSDAIEEINRRNSRHWKIQFQPVGWEDTIGGNRRPQSLINRDLETCDYFFGILNDHWGSPPQAEGDVDTAYTSGFHEEYELAQTLYKNGSMQDIFLFFRELSPERVRDAGPSLKRVLEFRKKVQDQRRPFYSEFSDSEAFLRKVGDTLSSIGWRGVQNQQDEEVKTSPQQSLPIESATSSHPGEEDLFVSGATREFLQNLLDRQRGNDAINNIEVARLRLIAVGEYRSGNDVLRLGVHDANLLFRDRKNLSLSSNEKNTLLTTGLKFMAHHNAPFWFWTDGSSIEAQSFIRRWMILSEGDEQLSAIKLATTLEYDLPEYRFDDSRKLLIRSWYAEDAAYKLTEAATKYLIQLGKPDDTDTLDSIKAEKVGQRATDMDSAIIAIALRKSQTEGFAALLDRDPENVHKLVLPMLEGGLVGLPSPELSRYTKLKSEGVRLIAVRELIPIVTEPDSRDSQKPTNLNRWRKQEVCDGFGDFVAIRL